MLDEFEQHPIFAAPVPVPEELARAAKRKKWPDGLLQRASDARVPRSDIGLWLGDGGQTAEQVRTEVPSVEATEGTRSLRCMGFEGPRLKVQANGTRPYTDLAYW